MTIQPISRVSVALYITPADLKKYGLTPGTLTLERAAKLARAAFAEAGIEPEGNIEIEAFPDACGVLVFARVRPKEALCFSFSDSESLLRAVSILAPPTRGAAAIDDPAHDEEATLSWFDGKYWLSLPTDDCRTAALLSEFGEEAQYDPWRVERLGEYGRTLLRGDVLGALQTYFLQ